MFGRHCAKGTEQHLTWHETFCEKFKLKIKRLLQPTTTTFICNGWSGSWQEWKSEWVRERNYVDMLTSFVYLLLLLLLAYCCCNFISSHSTYTSYEWKSVPLPPADTQWQSVHRLIFRESDLTWEIHLSTNKQQKKLLLGKLFPFYSVVIIICWKGKGARSKRWAEKKM